jgi:pyruvate/2-oxoglutarate/acetoin dehydrogenase E1 component/TPP-dependent pyruvate/acetoin dehydrogenase alpha subunit
MYEGEAKVTDQFDVSELNFGGFKNIVINDYRIAFESREASLIGRREVLTGKAKFGIFGDGKEVAQLAMAKAFRNGDWRAGYYRDQTFMFATGMSTITELFAQMYSNPDVNEDPASAGRQMNCHYATRSINPDGSWKNQVEMMNCSSDISTTGGQMARMVGLAYASKLYRENQELSYLRHFSDAGNEVCFGTIGNGATSEGAFFEAINAAGVLQIPMAISIWDDAYAISVPAELQTTKQDISEVLKGFQRDEKGDGFEIYKVCGWDYPALCETYEMAVKVCRENHIPVMIHVVEMTQPQGHSSSGSHERYKSEERLQWEKEYDCLVQMRKWMVQSAIATGEELDAIEAEAKTYVRSCQKKAWADYVKDIKHEADELLALLGSIRHPAIENLTHNLGTPGSITRREVMGTAREALRLLRGKDSEEKTKLLSWYNNQMEINHDRYHSRLFTDGIDSPMHIPAVAPLYAGETRMVDGREVLNACFDANFSRDPRIVAFGEDVGAIGDVNQGFAGLQAKYGTLRITDTGIRELTIVGQGMGLAMRGLKPIAEIQYLDYLVYALTVLTDDLASLSYRTKAGQKAPVIIRTRGHRLEGIWHSGSPMGMILGSLRGIHICVPRNMTQAAGLYNTLLRGDEPALVIESLNGYRLKEKMPANVGEFTVPLGKAEIIRAGADMTVISYGSTLRVVQEAADLLENMGISIEIIDPQTLLPFDTDQVCLASLKRTNKLLVVDEDLPGSASAFILQQVLEAQGGYYYLDSPPQTLTAASHRPPYGSDGDYFSKPSSDDVIEKVYAIFSEVNPAKFPPIY